MESKEELINWFKGRALPTGHFRISSYETTDNLANLIELALANMERGNKTSQAVLTRVKAKLEQSGTESIPVTA
jgi:hypothetical protein